MAHVAHAALRRVGMGGPCGVPGAEASLWAWVCCTYDDVVVFLLMFRMLLVLRVVEQS